MAPVLNPTVPLLAPSSVLMSAMANSPDAAPMLKAAGIQTEVHVYASGGHGFGINPNTKSSVGALRDEARNVSKDVFTPQQIAQLIAVSRPRSGAGARAARVGWASAALEAAPAPSERAAASQARVGRARAARLSFS